VRSLAAAFVLVLAAGAEAQVSTDGQTAETVRTSHPPPADRTQWEVRSNTTLVAYEVRSPRTAVTFERRRLVQTLGVDHALRLGGEESPWRLTTHLDLRLDQELGRTCDPEGRCLNESDPEERRDYQVLVDNGRFDAPQAHVTLRELERDVELRLGRQLLWDATGFARIDGGRVGWRRRFVDVSVYGGKQTRDASFLGSSGYAPLGSLRVSLPGELAPERVPEIAPPSPTWMLGGVASAGSAKVVRVGVAYREVQDADGLVSRRIGVVARSAPHPLLQLRAQAAVDPTDGTVGDGLGEAALGRGRVVTRLRFEHHEPRFALGTIWAWFDLVPVRELSLSMEWRPEEGWSVGAVAKGRESRPAQVEHDAGGEAWLRYRRGGWSAGVRSWVWGGDLGSVAATFLDAARRFGRTEVYGRLSVWHFDDPQRAELYATSVASALGARVRITRIAEARLELGYAHNRVVGHRFRGLASLTVRALR